MEYWPRLFHEKGALFVALVEDVGQALSFSTFRSVPSAVAYTHKIQDHSLASHTFSPISTLIFGHH